VTALVLPIAGNSSRFRHITSQPKWSLRIEGKTVLERSVESILSEPSIQVKNVVFVVKGDFEPLLERMHFHGNRLADIGRVVQLKTTLNGQALSVLSGLDYIADGEKFLVWNGDSALRAGWASNLRIGANWLLGAKLPGESWSFIRGENGRVFETAEKRRISDLASLGLYCFADKSNFCRALDSQRSIPGERYVAPLYNPLLEEGQEVTYSEIPSQDFLSFGTPLELIETCRSQGWQVPEELEGI
jgi:dTDP-glucose pyrophosphorylase